MDRFSFFSLLLLSINLWFVSSAESVQFIVNGTVLELDESNFDAAISAFNFIFVDFYAPWCGHCKELSPELDLAAPMLAQLENSIVIAKVNADKFTHLASKYEVDGFPTLKLFIHGIPEEYTGPRKADLLVHFLKKYVASNVSILESDSSIDRFIKNSGTYFPIFIGFGLNESLINEVAIKYKKNAWFSVAKGFSKDVMVRYGFDEVPALVSIHPRYEEQSIVYGPFSEMSLEDHVNLNLLPLVVPVRQDTLQQLKDGHRKVLLTIIDDEMSEKSQKVIKFLKTTSSTNRDLVFAYVGVKQWGEFAKTFEANKKEKLPKMIIWDRNEEYLSVVGSETLDEEDPESQIIKFLKGYREGNTILKSVRDSSLSGYIYILIAIVLVVLIILVAALFVLILSISHEDDDNTRQNQTKQKGESISSTHNRNDKIYELGSKDD